jgi:acyl-CoA thioester hydrolase
MFKHQIRVAYRDVTVGNHVYYSRYFDFLETVRNEIFRDVGFPLKKLQDENVIFPVIECSIKYRAAARYDDILTIESVVTDVRKVQFTLDYKVVRGDVVLATATTRHAVTNLEEKPVRMPPELFAALEQHLEVRP